MAEEVKAFKLSSGEEIISRVVKTTPDAYELDRPNMIGLAPIPQGNGIGIQLMPWFASNQDGIVKVWREHVVAETTPTDELAKGYLEKTSGFVLA